MLLPSNSPVLIKFEWLSSGPKGKFSYGLYYVGPLLKMNFVGSILSPILVPLRKLFRSFLVTTDNFVQTDGWLVIRNC